MIPDDDDEEILNLSRLSDGGKPMTSGGGRGYHVSAQQRLIRQRVLLKINK
jgi:hypothetical protein